MLQTWICFPDMYCLSQKMCKPFPLRKPAFQITFRYRHFILGQGTRFVRTNHIHGSQCLYRRKLSHNGSGAHHTGHTKCQHDRYDGRKSFRHCRYGKRYRCEEHFPHIPLLQHGNKKQQHTNSHCQNTEHLTQFSQLDL